MKLKYADLYFPWILQPFKIVIYMYKTVVFVLQVVVKVKSQGYRKIKFGCQCKRLCRWFLSLKRNNCEYYQIKSCDKSPNIPEASIANILVQRWALTRRAVLLNASTRSTFSGVKMHTMKWTPKTMETVEEHCASCKGSIGRRRTKVYYFLSL